jgi:hypothetical protein
MGRALALFTYKLRFFFGPALRGRFGPLVYLALILIFLPYGFLTGFGMGTAIRGADPEIALSVLSAPLALVFCLGLLYSLGPGVTAHVSEFDFFLTADVRPREYMLADVAFQFVSLMAAAGLAVGASAIALVLSVGRPILTALPMLAILGAYGAFVLLTSQVLVILRVRHPKAPVRLLTIVLLGFSILSALGLTLPGVPPAFGSLPLPSRAFAGLGLAALLGTPPNLIDAGLAAAFVGGIVLAWLPLSKSYIFHGLRPTLTAGFGQVNFGARIDLQRRFTARLGGITTRIRLRTDRGSETGLMTRLHLIRIWRDGSLVYVVFFAVVGILPASLGTARTGGGGVIAATQTLTFLLGLLAMNWAFSERDNLWIVLTSPNPPGSYFRGLMLSLAAIGLGTTVTSLALIALARSFLPPFEGVALPIASPIAAAFVAAAILTRVKLKPSALSLAALGIFFLVAVGGFLGGFAAQGIVAAAALLGTFAVEAQAASLFAFLFALTALGLWAVTRLAASFRL